MISDQSTFRASLLDPSRPAPDGLSDGQGRPAIKRFDVYRNNVTVALRDALRTAFPVIRKLIGDQNFDEAARVFLRNYPPTTPVMMTYGAEMPDFLATFAPLRHIEYLPDVARLEQALRRSYHAADPPDFDPARLAAMDPDALMASRVTFAAPVELIPSSWPLFEIWHYNSEANAPKPRAIPQPVLITRPGFDPIPRPLKRSEAAWVQAIRDGATLENAQDAATEVAATFDLSDLLTCLLQDRAIVELKTPKD